MVRIQKLFLVNLMALGSLGLLLTSCGTSVDSTTSSPESASELATSSISGAISSADSSGGSLAYEPNASKWEGFFNSLLSLTEKNAWAITACQQPKDNLGSCSAGVITVNYGTGCNFLKSDGSAYPATWTGSLTAAFSSAGTAYCPSASSFPLASSGTGSTFPISITRTMTNVTKTNGTLKVTVDTSVASGWDTSITPQKVGGTVITVNSATAHSITINGIHYSAAKTFTNKKGETKTGTVWDHTVSTNGAITTTKSGNVTSSSGTMVLQHNLAKYTATATIASTAAVTHDRTTCGCLPTGGTIQTTFTGSRTDFEILTITGCGTATLQTGANQAAAQAATATALTLTHCQ